MHTALLPFRRYFEFSGRSRQREYWLFVLLLIVVSAIATLLDSWLGLGGGVETTTINTANEISINQTVHGGVLSWVWFLATLCPLLAVSVRRLHDIDRTGWWILINLIPLLGWVVWLVFMCTGGTRGPNRFGADPVPAG